MFEILEHLLLIEPKKIWEKNWHITLILSLAPVLRKISLGSQYWPSLSAIYLAMSSRITLTPELSLYDPYEI